MTANVSLPFVNQLCQSDEQAIETECFSKSYNMCNKVSFSVKFHTHEFQSDSLRFNSPWAVHES